MLRTALSLSMVTGQPFRIINIRAGRARPGLLRQYQVAVQAAARICDADVADLVAQLLCHRLPAEVGPGNVLLLTLEHEHVTEVFAGFGEKMVRAETVAKQTLERARRYVASGAAVSECLADQLMLPMALAGAGSFTTDALSSHALTNAQVIARFLAVRFECEPMGERHLVRLVSCN